MNKEINNMLKTRLKETKRITGTKRSLGRMKQALPPAGQRTKPHKPQVFSSAQESGEATWPWLSEWEVRGCLWFPIKTSLHLFGYFSKSYIAFPCNM